MEQLKHTPNLPKVPQRKPPWWWYVAGYSTSAILMLPGFVLTVSVIFAFFGIPLLIIGGIPAYWVHAKSLAWDLRDQAPDEDRNGDRAPRPWE